MGDSFEKFLAIPTSQKVAAFMAMMGLVGAAWYFLFFEETQAAISAANAVTPQLSQDLSREQEVAKNLPKYEAEVEELKRARDEMRDRLPENAEIADLLQKIHGQAKIVGLEISRFERQSVELEEMYARIPVQMALKGTFYEITQFFFYLGRMTRIVNIGDITLITLDRKGDRPDLLQATCTATTFMYLPPSKAKPKKGKKKKKKKKKKKGH